MVPDLSKISASYYNQIKELGSIGSTNIDNNKIHSSIITDRTGQKFIKVQVDGEYYYGSLADSIYNFDVKIPISNTPDALTARKDWSWYILNNNNEEKTESIIKNSVLNGSLSPVTLDGNTLSVGGTGTWQIIVAEGFTSSTETQGNLNGGPGLASTQDDHQLAPTHFTIYDSIINATNDAKSGLVSVTNLPSTQDGKSQFDVHMTGKASLINVMTGQTYDATITYSYGTGDNNFITGDQVTDWSKVKSIKVVPNGGAPSMTSLRLVVPVEDKTVYDDVGKTIYMSTMTYGEDKTNTSYTTKDGFAVPEKSTILPIIIKAGDMASANLTVKGQATVHTLIHYKDENGKDVYVKLADQDKTYKELQDTMKRSDYLQSDSDLTIADRGLLPTGMIINYSNPTIRNSNNTYASGYANNVATFDKTAKYDFDGDQVIFEGAMPEIITKTHQAKETIHYVYRDGRPAKPDKVLTSITLKQTGSKNPFTGEITWDTPTTDTLNSVDSPEITGYIADKLTVPSYVVTMTSPDKEVTVTYDADNETADFTYFDDTTNSTLKVVKKSGKSNASIGYTTTDEINNYEKQGYTLVSDDTNGRNLNFDSLPAVDQHYMIHLKHKTESVTRNGTVTRTIHYLYDNGNTAKPDKTQTVSFNETGTKDDVTGETTWDNDNAQTVDSVITPSITGYTPDKSSIEGQAFKFGDKDVEVTVTYTANAQTATITYIDDTENKTLGSDKQNGKFNQAITFEHDPAEVIKGLEEKGYKLVSNDFNGNKYQADNSNNVFYVHLKHGTSESSRKDDVNMTVHYVMDDGSKAPSDSTQTVSFTENGIKDNVTGNITWTPATSQTLKDVDSPVLTGYTADIKTANGKVVNFGDPDINVTVHYSANAQTATITYIDDTESKTLGSDVQNGKFNQVIAFEHDPTAEIASYKKQGYVLVSNNFDNQKYQADNKSNSFEVHLKHGTENVSRKDDVNMTVHYVMDDGSDAPSDNKQTLSFTENGTQDLVTKDITWTPADSKTFKDVVTPKIAGYTPDQDKVAGQTVKFGDDDAEVTVTYSPNVQLGHINYIDDSTKKTLTRDDFSGRTNEHEDYTSIDRIQEFENKGYELVSNDYPDGGFNFDNNDRQDQVFNVHLKHGTVTVTTENPQTPNTPINPDPQSPKYPKDISNTNSDVKRTIDYKFKDDKTAQPTVNDSLHFERTVVIDKVTGKVLSDTWTQSQDFNDIQTPAIQGYTPDRTVVSDKNIGHDHQDIIEHVVYSPDVQHMTITYIDDTTGKTLHTDKPNGVSDQDAKYTTSDTIKQYEDQHYKLVSDSTKGQDLIFDHDDNVDQTYEVHFVHDTQKVNRQDTVTSTIDYKFEDGKTAQPTVTQTKHFSENGIKDLVTGKITWDEATPQKFEDVATKSIVGYTPDKDNVVGGTVKFGDKDVEVTVTYHNNAQTAKITYIDDTEKKTLGSEQQNGKFDHEIVFEHDPAEVIKGWEEKGYKLVSNDFKQGIKYQANNKSNSFEVHLVHTYEPVETSQTITETVHYIDANGKPVAPDHVATVVIKVTGTRDKVTDSITWNTPSTGHFDEVISPEVPNMTPDKKFIPSRNVQYGDSDITENVVYTSDETSREPEKPNDQGKPNSKTPEKPNKSGNPTSKTSEKSNKSGNPTSKTSEKSNKSSKEVSKQFGTIAKTTIPEKPIDSRTVDNHVSAKTTTKRELPQTGTTANTGIWTGLVSIITSLGLLGASKKRKKN
ncbi:mucin-binding protein [Lactobacillus crispatus]|uniref:mucin-binding protein n=1 Tax=Lactobacillus crispatus TaxID=47770 RepID=UPI00197B1954|nr:LPXTG cell wall anchor domain-containing protein [Lactobacillus crispatus]